MNVGQGSWPAFGTLLYSRHVASYIHWLLGQTQEAGRIDGDEVERMAGTVALEGECVHKDGYVEKESGQSLLGSVGLLAATTVSLNRSMVRLDDN